METSVKGIYAIGDVAGPPMLAHKGQREGVVFAEFLSGQKHVHQVNYGNIPNATYCHPEVASIGMTELTFTPTLADVAEVDRLADLVL